MFFKRCYKKKDENLEEKKYNKLMEYTALHNLQADFRSIHYYVVRIQNHLMKLI